MMWVLIAVALVAAVVAARTIEPRQVTLMPLPTPTTASSTPQGLEVVGSMASPYDVFGGLGPDWTFLEEDTTPTGTPTLAGTQLLRTARVSSLHEPLQMSLEEADVTSVTQLSHAMGALHATAFDSSSTSTAELKLAKTKTEELVIVAGTSRVLVIHLPLNTDLGKHLPPDLGSFLVTVHEP